MTGSRLMMTAATAAAIGAMSGYFRTVLEKQRKLIADIRRAARISPHHQLLNSVRSSLHDHQNHRQLEKRRRDSIDRQINKLEINSKSAEDFAKRGDRQMDSAAFPPIKDTLNKFEQKLREENKTERQARSKSSTPRPGGKKKRRNKGKGV